MTLPSTATLREQLGAAEDGLDGVVIPKPLFLALLDALDVCPQPLDINEPCTCPEAQRTISGLEQDLETWLDEEHMLRRTLAQCQTALAAALVYASAGGASNADIALWELISDGAIMMAAPIAEREAVARRAAATPPPEETP